MRHQAQACCIVSAQPGRGMKAESRTLSRRVSQKLTWRFAKPANDRLPSGRQVAKTPVSTMREKAGGSPKGSKKGLAMNRCAVCCGMRSMPRARLAPLMWRRPGTPMGSGHWRSLSTYACTEGRFGYPHDSTAWTVILTLRDTLLESGVAQRGARERARARSDGALSMGGP